MPWKASSVMEERLGQATLLLNTIATPALTGWVTSVVTSWASSVSSLVCAIIVSNCLRECVVDSATNSNGDCAPISFRIAYQPGLIPRISDLSSYAILKFQNWCRNKSSRHHANCIALLGRVGRASGSLIDRWCQRCARPAAALP